MRLSFLILVLLYSISTFAQTKLISHRSHSGSDENFKIAFNKNLFDLGGSNLGEAPQRMVRNSKLDTVIFVSDKKSVMITSEQCNQLDWDVSQRITRKTKWKAGKDTVQNHPLFTRKHSLDSIKSVLKSDYNFANDVDDVIFIGFDNKIRKDKKKKKGFAPMYSDTPQFPTGLGLTIILFVLCIFTAYFFVQAFRERKLSAE